MHLVRRLGRLVLESWFLLALASALWYSIGATTFRSEVGITVLNNGVTQEGKGVIVYVTGGALLQIWQLLFILPYLRALWRPFNEAPRLRAFVAILLWGIYQVALALIGYIFVQDAAKELAWFLWLQEAFPAIVALSILMNYVLSWYVLRIEYGDLLRKRDRFICSIKLPVVTIVTWLAAISTGWITTDFVHTEVLWVCLIILPQHMLLPLALLFKIWQPFRNRVH